MSELIKGTALSEIKLNGAYVKPGEKFETDEATMAHLIRNGVVEDPAVAKAAREAEKASTAEADEKAAKIIEAAESKAKEITETAAAEADEKAQTVTNEAIAEADKLVADAKAEANKLVADAKAQAEKIVKDAQEAAKKPAEAKPAPTSK